MYSYNVEEIYNRLFEKYYSDDQLLDWESVTFFGGGNANKFKDKIQEILKQGKKVKTGYKTSKTVRGAKTRYIFYK